MSAAVSRFLPPGAPDQTGWGVLVSIMAHGLLVAAVLFWPSFGMSRREIFAPTYQVQLVGAPRLPAARPAAPPPAKKTQPAAVQKPRPAPKPKPQPKPKPKAKEAIGTKKTVTKRKVVEKKRAPAPDVSRLLDKKINRLQTQVNERRRLDSVMDRLQQKVASRADNDQAGAFAAGAGPAAGDLSVRFSVYYTEIWERVRRAWVLPEALVAKPGGLSAVVVVRINRDGSLAKVWLEQGSGNQRFDASALRAAERAAPYPPLPAGMRSSSHEVGIRFRDEDVTG